MTAFQELVKPACLRRPRMDASAFRETPAEQLDEGNREV